MTQNNKIKRRYNMEQACTMAQIADELEVDVASLIEWEQEGFDAEFEELIKTQPLEIRNLLLLFISRACDYAAFRILKEVEDFPAEDEVSEMKRVANIIKDRTEFVLQCDQRLRRTYPIAATHLGDRVLNHL